MWASGKLSFDQAIKEPPGFIRFRTCDPVRGRLRLSDRIDAAWILEEGGWLPGTDSNRRPTEEFSA